MEMRICDPIVGWQRELQGEADSVTHLAVVVAQSQEPSSPGPFSLEYQGEGETVFGLRQAARDGNERLCPFNTEPNTTLSSIEH